MGINAEYMGSSSLQPVRASNRNEVDIADSVSSLSVRERNALCSRGETGWEGLQIWHRQGLQWSRHQGGRHQARQDLRRWKDQDQDKEECGRRLSSSWQRYWRGKRLYLVRDRVL